MNQPDQLGRDVVLATVLFVLLLGLATVGRLQFVSMWLLPIPLVVFTALRIRWVPVVMAALVGTLFYVSGYGWFALLLAGAVYLTGLSMGESIRQGDSPYAALITGTLIFVMVELVLLAFWHWLGIDVYASVRRLFEYYVTQNKALAPGAAAQFAQTATEQVKLLTPAFISVLAFLAAALDLLAARWLLGNSLPKKDLLLSYRLPYSVVVIYVFALTFVVFNWGEDSPFWWQVLNNAVYLAGFFIGIQGIAFVWRNIQHVRFRYALLAAMLATMLEASINRIVGSVYILLGLLDLMNAARRAR